MYKSEQQLLALCYQWFHNEYPAYRGLLFHPANELPVSGRDGAIKMMQLKAQGLVPGIPDFVFVLERVYGIEMKMPGGKLSGAQKNIAQTWVRAGSCFFILDNITDFKDVMICIILGKYKAENKIINLTNIKI